MLQQTLHLYQRAYQGLSPSVWLLAGVMLINRCGTMVLPFMTLYLTQHLHYSVTDAGLVMAVYGMGAFVGTFLGGRLTDRYGFYYVQLISLLFSGAFLLVLQFVVDFWALCGSVFVFTLFGDAFRPANQAAIAHYSEPETRTRAFSLNRLAINLGWAAGGGLGGWLAGINYNLLFWTDGLTCLVASLVLGIFLPVPTLTDTISLGTNEAAMAKVPPTASPYQDTLFVGFVICATLYLIAFMQLFSIVPLFFKQVLHMNERLIGLMMALNGVLIVLIEMALVYSLEQQKRSKTRLILAGVILTALGYLVLMIPGWWGQDVSYSTALGFILLVTVSEMLAVPFIQSFTVERAMAATRGQYLALYSMGGALAQTIAPAFGSFMVNQVGFSMHWLIVACISFVSAGGFWWLGNQLKRNAQEKALIEL